MFFYYLTLLLFFNNCMFASEKCSMTMHMDAIDKSGEFLLCTNSGNFGVDCGIFSIKNNKPELLLSAHIKNEDITNFTDAITAFLTQLNETYSLTVKYACFAGPGVPSAQQDYLEHWRLPYVINAKEIIVRNNLTLAIIVNDFLAMSYGVSYVDSKKVTTLYDVPAEKHGNRVIIGAGSGLGTVLMMWNKHEQAYESFPAEAGTGDFPALDAFELELSIRMRQLRNFKTIHWAFFVAQPGIQYLYQILQDMNYEKCASNKKYADAMTILADAQNDACCAKAAELFYSFYARFVYNFAWNTLPFGGIYLVGETATEHPEMLQSMFLPAYFSCVENKLSLLQRIPIYVIKEDVTVGLYGIAHYFLQDKKNTTGSSFFGELQQKITSMFEHVKCIILKRC